MIENNGVMEHWVFPLPHHSTTPVRLVPLPRGVICVSLRRCPNCELPLCFPLLQKWPARSG